ncbi:MAG: TonB-dependent receptor [Acidobacteriota bacterium]|nr:TonB-dependent receptor [Acidobacteriota bacterium]
MLRTSPLVRIGIFSGIIAAGSAFAEAQTPTPTPAAVQEDVVVSAARGPEIETEIPGQATVISGERLRRENVKTLADALQDVVGIDTGLGSDNGARLPNIGMWGLKEFDALLVMVDGVPVGGPFNPSLAQINIEDVERIEIVKGPQGTLYGVSAFAGMIQVFTRSDARGTELRLGGGSFSEGRLNFSHSQPVGPAKIRIFGTFDRAKGWQDRTDYREDQGGLRFDLPLSGGGNLAVIGNVSRTTQFFGSPIPVDAGEVVPGFRIDRNYSVDGGRLDHHIVSLTTRFEKSLSSSVSLENVLGASRDDQTSIRSFVGEVAGNTAGAAGVALKPRETVVYDDFHVVAKFNAAGHHRLVAGAALTWGRTTAAGTGFDIEIQIDLVVVPTFAETPAGDHRSFVDRRTFLGLYVNDEWTPLPFLTFTGGARFDSVSEALFAQGQEVGTPQPEVTRDSRSDGQWSGGVAALARVVADRPGIMNSVHAYIAAKSAFKPAAPNLTEAENARILDPERTRSGEAGVKTRWLDRELSIDLSLFHMIFENLVVSTLGPGGEPVLVNAGSQRFQGAELEVGYHPASLPDLYAAGGYAHHDARFIRFSFLTPDGSLRVVDGKRLELVPRDLWSVRLGYAPKTGPGAFVAVRHQGRRPLTRRNTFFTDGFFESDAGVSWNLPHARFSLVGRNLGSSRHYTSESEIGDSQFYVAPPRRFFAELTLSF